LSLEFSGINVSHQVFVKFEKLSCYELHIQWHNVMWNSIEKWTESIMIIKTMKKTILFNCFLFFSCNKIPAAGRKSTSNQKLNLIPSVIQIEIKGYWKVHKHRKGSLQTSFIFTKKTDINFPIVENKRKTKIKKQRPNTCNLIFEAKYIINGFANDTLKNPNRLCYRKDNLRLKNATKGNRQQPFWA
jgi:hypothetical protein